MPQRHYSVIVVPDAWSDSLEGLARVVAPMTSVRSQQLVPVLRRGPMTLDADLSRDEADRLFERLVSLDVPSRILDGDDEVVREIEVAEADPSDPPEAEPGKAVEPEEPEEPAPQEAPDDVDALEPDEDWDAFMGNADVEELEVPDSSGAFGAEVAELAEQESGESHPESNTPPPQIPSRGFEAGPEASEPTTRPEPSPDEAPPIGSMAESGFDASRLNAALETDAERPPYAPEGFDDRGEHIPALAAVLSLVAPGAGQTYNGEPERSWEFGVRFALLVPWYRSVRQAWERAEQIRTYYAPRPSEGAFGRALKYAASWWIIVGGVVALLGFGGFAGYNALTRPERPKITESDIRSAHDEARRQVTLARIGGLDGVSRHLDERDQAQQRFTMSDEERVERLFRRGYQSCRSRELTTCQAVMKRVSSLSPKYRREAYKLQAWASMQGSPDSPDAPMPKVDVDSLEAFESGRGSDEGEADGGTRSDEDPSGDGEVEVDNQAPENPAPSDGDNTP